MEGQGQGLVAGPRGEAEPGLMETNQGKYFDADEYDNLKQISYFCQTDSIKGDLKISA